MLQHILQKEFELDPHEVDDVLKTSNDHGVRWSYPGQADYPFYWNFLSKKPPVFSYLGNPVWKQMPTLSVVGSRTPLRETCLWMQRELGHFLRDNEICVVSGGARGVDQWAHRLAMDFGRPTVCVLPSGLLDPYPPNFSEAIGNRILKEGGALVSTFPLREAMRKSHFHIRNRWICGFSHTTFVVEANRRSGSWLTARLARDEGREVATLPVFPHSSQGLGNLDLIHDGAQMIRDASDLAIFYGRNSLRISP